MIDIAIIGAGPVGLACAIEANRHGLQAIAFDKGALVHSLVGYPMGMEFFSTPDLIEIGGHPFPTRGYKPTREEALEYYRGVTEREGLDVRLYEPVVRVDGEAGRFEVVTAAGVYPARHVVVAIGFFDHPNRLAVPGEDLPKVTHYYREPFAYVRQKVAVIGAKNSAAKAALDCHRHGAEVTLVVRGAALSEKVKYWLRPDLANRIAEGSIRAYFQTTVTVIGERTIALATPDGPREIPNDWVLALTGYHPDYRLLDTLGIRVGEDEFRTPIFDPVTFETSRPGMYLAGTVCGGYRTGRWFIENGRHHARQIAAHIAGRRVEPVAFDRIHWKTEE